MIKSTSVKSSDHTEISLTDPSLYINRELSHLNFNIRVLDQTLDERHPIFERLKFLLIFSRNIDEFFEIRIAKIKRSIKFNRETTGPDGMHSVEVLEKIFHICQQQIQRQYQILNDTLLPALKKEKIYFLRRRHWTQTQSKWVANYFAENITPVISPLALDPAHPFPRLVNKSLNFIVELEGKDAFGRDSGLAIVPAPRSQPRLIQLPDDICGDGNSFVFLSSMIHAHINELFPGMKASGCYQFRITRNADLEMNDEEIVDLAMALKGELHSRRFGSAVRLEIVDSCPQHLQKFLLEQFNLSEQEIFCVNGPVNLQRLMQILEAVNKPSLKYRPFTPHIPEQLLDGKDYFEAIKQRDFLLLHPFESFTPVIDLLRQAAKDPEVLSIKQTFYRTGANSEIVDALVDAARNGKEVTAVIELKARFDEEYNLQLATRLQEAGAVVCYGVVGYKTHAKMMIILRKEEKKLFRFVHLGTGNYHSSNARIYTDYSLLTCDENIGTDINKLFQQLTGMGKITRIKKIFNSPFTLKKKLLQLIQQEANYANDGKPARIIIKVNSITEPKLIQALYEASRCGVKIDLIVRGICCLRPGVAGVSNNIQVRSIVGEFLEHARVYYFENNEAKIFCSSADFMERNMKHRIEACFPIENPKLAKRVKDELDMYLRDRGQSWILNSDGDYILNQQKNTDTVTYVQDLLLEKLSPFRKEQS